MKVLFLDYSTEYYSTLSGTHVPAKRTGKFVQIRHGQTEYLLFSPKEFTRYHADIVKRFCDERGIDGFLNTTVKSFEIYDPDWMVIGGGKFELDSAEKHLRLYDDSMAYGRFDAKGLKKKILSIDIFSDFKVQIE
jgi:Janus/Ocnus family (Ocnus)